MNGLRKAAISSCTPISLRNGCTKNWRSSAMRTSLPRSASPWALRQAGRGPVGTIGRMFAGAVRPSKPASLQIWIISVNGTAYTPKVLTDAILAAEKIKKPMQLQFRRDDRYITSLFLSTMACAIHRSSALKERRTVSTTSLRRARARYPQCSESARRVQVCF